MLNSAGAPSTSITGTPTAPGSFAFTIEVEDGSGSTAEVALTLEIADEADELVFAQAAILPPGIVGLAYTATLTASGGVGDYSWSVVADGLPNGLNLGPTGTPSTQITGTPALEATFAFTIRVQDSAGQFVERRLTLTVDTADPLQIVTNDLPVAAPGQPYAAPLAAEGGVSPIEWDAQGLPPGLSVRVTSDNTAEIAGTPTEVGVRAVTVSATDVIGTTTARSYDLLVSDFAVITESLPPGTECQVYSANISVAGTPGVTYTWTATTPAGLELRGMGTTAELVGTPLRTGPQLVQVSVTDGTLTASAEIPISVESDPQSLRWVAMVGELVAAGVRDVHAADICGTTITVSSTVSPATDFGDASATATDQVRLSPGGDAVAFVGDFRVNGFNELFVAPLDAGGHGPAIRVSGDLDTTNNNISDFRWSPDGRHLVYRADQPTDGQFELYAVDLDDPTVAVRLVDDIPEGGDVYTDDIAWSPDSRWVAFHADANVNGQNEVFLADRLGAVPYTVYTANTSPPAGSISDDFAWLPNGAGMLFRGAMLASGVNELFVVSTTGTTPSAPTRVSGLLPDGGDVNAFTLSPDGTAVAYLADERTNDVQELFVVSLAADGSPGEGVVVNAPLVDGGQVNAFRWSDDSSRILYTANGISADQVELFVVEGPNFGTARRVSGPMIDGGNIRGEVDASDEALPPGFGFSPDGQRAAYIADSTVDEAYALHLADLTVVRGTVVDESFADGERTIDAPPESLSWFSSSGGSSLTVASEAMTLNTGGTSGRHAAAYFPAVTLGIGNEIRLEFDFVVSGLRAINNSLRIALFDTRGTPVIDGDSQNPDSLVHGGYGTFTAFTANAGSNLSLRKRSLAANRLITTASAYSNLGSQGDPSAGFEEGTTYHATLIVRRTAENQAEVTIRFEGGTLSGHELVRVDTTDIYTRFDGVVFAVTSSSQVTGADTMTIDNLTVEVDSEGAATVVVAPAPGAGEGVNDFTFAPDGQWLAFRGSLEGSATLEAYAASLASGDGFGVGNVLHGNLPAGASISSGDTNFGWTPNSAYVIGVGDLDTLGLPEAWAFAPEGGVAPVRLSSPAAPGGGGVHFTVIPR